MIPRKVPPRGKPGRKRALGAADKALIVQGIASYLSRNRAADMVGIHPTTLANEMARDPDFAEQIKQAEATRLQNCLQKIIEAGDKDHRALTWYVENMYHDEFGPRQKIETVISGDPNNPLVVKNLSDEDLERIIRNSTNPGRSR